MAIHLFIGAIFFLQPIAAHSLGVAASGNPSAEFVLTVLVDPPVNAAGSTGTVTFMAENLGPDDMSVIIFGDVGDVGYERVIFGASSNPNCEFAQSFDIDPLPGEPLPLTTIFRPSSPIPAGTTFVCEAPFLVNPLLEGEFESLWVLRVSAFNAELDLSDNRRSIVFGTPVAKAVPALSPFSLGIIAIFVLIVGRRAFVKASLNFP